MAEVTPDEQGLFIVPDMDDTTELHTVQDVPKYLMPSKVYDVLKWVAIIVCPALATLVSHVGNALEYGQADEMAIIIVEVGLFIGACIGVSHVSAMGRG